MVYLDYELGESTRIEEKRLKNFAWTQRRRDSYGGAAGYFFSISAFTFTFFYFYRKFNQYSTFKRLLGTGLLAIGVFEEASLLSVANLGNVTEYYKLTKNPLDTIEKFYLEQQIQNRKALIRHQANKERMERELGQV
jgi:hypothetical protein